MTTTNNPEPIEAMLVSAPPTEAEAVARAVARPVEFAPFASDERASRFIAHPEGFDVLEVAPLPPKLTPDAQTGTYAAFTAEGFVALVDSLSPGVSSIPAEERQFPYRLTATQKEIRALLDPGAIDGPSFELLTAVYAPAVSDELGEWIAASKPHGLEQWERFVEDHLVDIDAAGEQAGAISGLDVLQDARNWNVEARTVNRRIKTDDGDLDAANELKMRVIGSALGSFFIEVPILRFGEPLALRIVLTRDLDNMTIAPRIPGIQRVIDRACAREFARVEGDLGTAIR